MEFTDFLNVAWKVGAGIGGLAVGVGALYRLISKDARADKGELITAAEKEINFYKERAKKYEDDLATERKDWNTKFLELHKEVGTLSGRLDAQIKVNSDYKEMLENRDPDTKKFNTEMLAGMKSISEFMQKINTHMEDEKKKEMHIEAQITKT